MTTGLAQLDRNFVMHRGEIREIDDRRGKLLPNTALQQSGAELANLRLALGSYALMRNQRLSKFSTAPAAERQVR